MQDRSGSVCSRTLGNGLIGGISVLETGQQDNHPRVQDPETVSAWQQLILGNGLDTAVIYSNLLSAMEVSFHSSNDSNNRFIDHSLNRHLQTTVIDRLYRDVKIHSTPNAILVSRCDLRKRVLLFLRQNAANFFVKWKKTFYAKN